MVDGESFSVDAIIPTTERKSNVVLSCENFNIKVTNTVANVLKDTEEGYVIEGNESSAKFCDSIIDYNTEGTQIEEMDVTIHSSGGDYYIEAVFTNMPIYSLFYGVTENGVAYSFDRAPKSNDTYSDSILDFVFDEQDSMLVENMETGVRIPVNSDRVSNLFENQITPALKIS